MSDFDFQTQQEELARRQKLIDAMLAGQPLQAGQGSSGGFWNTVNNGIGQLKAKGMQEQLTADTAAFRGKYGEALGRESNQFLDLANGKPSVPPAYDGVGPPTPPVQANPREAVIRAMTSQLPEMQAMGKAAFSNLSKPAAGDETFGHDPKTVIGPDGKPMLVVQGNRGTTKPLQGYSPESTEWGPVVSVGTSPDGKPLMGQVNAKTKEIRYAPSGGQQINIDTKGEGIALNNLPKVLEGARGQMITANKSREAAERIYKLADDPEVITGFGANVLSGVAAAGAKLGFNGPEGVAKTQALFTDLAKSTLDGLQQMKGSSSDKDVQFLQDVTAGKISLTPQVMKQVAGISFAANHNATLDANDQYSSAAAIQGGAPIAAQYPTPKLRYQALDPKNFTEDDNGRLTYNSPLLQPASKQPGKTNAQGRRVMTMEEFLEGSQ